VLSVKLTGAPVEVVLEAVGDGVLAAVDVVLDVPMKGISELGNVLD
jgi:cyanate lyase